MGSKRYRNKPCVYCGREGAAETADHVIARAFFLDDEQVSLPKVPACAICNNAKSRLEHYVVSVLPMGGMHRRADETIAEQVGPRLARNEALRRALEHGRRDRFIRGPDLIWREGMSVPFDGQKLSELSCYIAIGLAWHHWRIQLAPTAFASGRTFSPQGAMDFESMLAHFPPARRAEHSYGNGEFSYCGGYLDTNPNVTFWQMWFYGGVELGSHQQRGETTRSMFVLTDDTPEWIERHAPERADGLAPISKD